MATVNDPGGNSALNQPGSVAKNTNEQSERVCYHIVISGFVQGVGFRPFVFRLANELGVKGFVANTTGQVTIQAEADQHTIDQFVRRMIENAPPNAKPMIESATEISLSNYHDFTITHSQELSKPDIHVLADLPVCEQCLEELFDKTDRRYLYPFINCTQCGPRYSIITALPYDRKNTSMHSFALCPQCALEYQSPDDRRFHAEPVACEQCGPVLNYVDVSTNIRDNRLALDATLAALQQGKIVAVKGISGYHLVCDAMNEKTITLLRQRKQRADKPFAILMQEAELEYYVIASDNEKSLLKQNCRPIVPIQRNIKSTLPDNLAPGIKKLGVMLPGNPLQYLICHFFKKPLVYTSGNISGEPIISENGDASKRLLSLCDAFLHHDRAIVRAADDPVMMHNGKQAQLLRTGRGLAPAEFTLPFTLEKPLLAVGGHVKNTIALAWKNRMVISVQNGDLGSLRSYQAMQRSISDMQRLYKVKAEQVICDAHPDYGSTLWANESGLPVTTVLHHHAHASSLTLEYPEIKNWLIFSWDGIGLGRDGQLWGGETFQGAPGKWKRVASFKPFRLPGGDKTSRQAWRVAASLYWHSNLDFERPGQNTENLKHMWDKKINSPQSSAVGRLFSAAAAILGLVETESFEGHGPMLLEALAETSVAQAIDLPFVEDDDTIIRIDWRPLVKMLTDSSLSMASRARCFHETLADTVTKLSLQHYQHNRDITVGLCGGVFQNQLLLKLISSRLLQHKIKILIPQAIPVNDGGLSAGQVIEYYYQ